MEYIQLRNTELSVSRFCMGGCPMGGYGWGAVQEDELIAAIHSALENGVNFFDTADTYGLGQSEVTLAKGLGGHRSEVVINSKFGVRAGSGKTFYDNSPAYIEKALNNSLKRLKTDYIDVYTIHYRDGVTPMEVVVKKLESLKKAGKIRYFGLSNMHERDLDEILPFKGKFVCCQDEYSLAKRENEADLRRFQNDLDVTPMTWGSLGQGILTGKYGRDSIFEANDRRSREIYINFHGDRLEKNMKIVDELKRISERRGKSIPSCAIRFILDVLDESVVLTGVKRPEQLLSNLEAMDWHLDSDEIDKLKKVSSFTVTANKPGGVILLVALASNSCQNIRGNMQLFCGREAA